LAMCAEEASSEGAIAVPVEHQELRASS